MLDLISFLLGFVSAEVLMCIIFTLIHLYKEFVKNKQERAMLLNIQNGLIDPFKIEDIE